MVDRETDGRQRLILRFTFSKRGRTLLETTSRKILNPKKLNSHKTKPLFLIDPKTSKKQETQKKQKQEGTDFKGKVTRDQVLFTLNDENTRRV